MINDHGLLDSGSSLAGRKPGSLGRNDNLECSRRRGRRLESFAMNGDRAAAPVWAAPCARPRRNQKVTLSLIAAAASADTTLRATKSSQFLNFALARASMIAFEPDGPIFGSLSRSAAGAVLRLTLAATGAVA